jgi:hypothetical protein
MGFMDYTVPPRVRITAKITYEVVWTDAFKFERQLGECDPNTKQIKIKTGMNARKQYFVYLHEVLHAISFEADLELTEKQVEGLENSLNRLSRLNGHQFF